MMNALLLTDTAPHAFSGTNVEGFPLLMVVSVIIVYLIVWAVNHVSILSIQKKTERVKELSTVMQHAFNISSKHVLRLSIPEQRLYNMHSDLLPPEGISFQEALTYIHPDDHPTYTAFIHQLTHEARTAECIVRWDDSTSQHLGQWRYIHHIGTADYTNKKQKTPLNLFLTLSDRTEQIEQEMNQDELMGKYRTMFEQSIIGQAFYDKDGRLITANHRMQELLNFQADKDPRYYSRPLYNTDLFRGILDIDHPEDISFCTRLVIAERGVNRYVELRTRPVFNNQGELVYITLAIRDTAQERELYLQNKRNDEELRLANEAILQYETELQYLMDNCNMHFWHASFETREVKFYQSISNSERTLTFDQVIAAFIDDPSITEKFQHPEQYYKEPVNRLIHTRPLICNSSKPQWNIIDTVPRYDDQGNITGIFGIARNVTDLINKQAQLKEETERANDAGRRKSAFMANMTHEIRTPLNAIMGFSDILPMITSEAEKQEIIRVIMNNCDMLLRLINDILAISALEEGSIHIQPEPTDFARDFNAICRPLVQRIQDPGVAFIQENPYSEFHTTIDKGRIQQVVTNFVTNAVKYTHQGYIKVGYEYREEDGGGLYIYCKDTGAGIPKESQEKIFDRFVKLNDFVQGTGLGLSICKAIADGCNGRIGVDSEGEGRGSTFWLWVPCRREDTTTHKN